MGDEGGRDNIMELGVGCCSLWEEEGKGMMIMKVKGGFLLCGIVEK